uniref:Uncharacterized protein n=1 Tax=Tanacetum cinerariifolium TaxID=118510 RepID=A0A699K6E5_TANCI|nr:hypothetical protein [Tanacetum cinerariifolium]
MHPCGDGDMGVVAMVVDRQASDGRVAVVRMAAVGGDGWGYEGGGDDAGWWRELSVSKTNELIKEALPRMADDAVTQDRESAQTDNTVLNVHPTTSTSTATTTTFDLQHQLYLKMKPDLQAQVANPELWDVLKRKFVKSSASPGPCRIDTFRKRDHDDHQEDNAPSKGEKIAEIQKTSKGLKSASVSSSKQPVYISKTSTSERQQQQQEWDA